MRNQVKKHLLNIFLHFPYQQNNSYHHRRPMDWSGVIYPLWIRWLFQIPLSLPCRGRCGMKDSPIIFPNKQVMLTKLLQFSGSPSCLWKWVTHITCFVLLIRNLPPEKLSQAIQDDREPPSNGIGQISHHPWVYLILFHGHVHTQ